MKQPSNSQATQQPSRTLSSVRNALPSHSPTSNRSRLNGKNNGKLITPGSEPPVRESPGRRKLETRPTRLDFSSCKKKLENLLPVKTLYKWFTGKQIFQLFGTRQVCLFLSSLFKSHLQQALRLARQVQLVYMIHAPCVSRKLTPSAQNLGSSHK